MSVARITEISSSSDKNFEDAIEQDRAGHADTAWYKKRLGQGARGASREWKDRLVQGDHENHFRA